MAQLRKPKRPWKKKRRSNGAAARQLIRDQYRHYGVVGYMEKLGVDTKGEIKGG